VLIRILIDVVVILPSRSGPGPGTTRRCLGLRLRCMIPRLEVCHDDGKMETESLFIVHRKVKYNTADARPVDVGYCTKKLPSQAGDLKKDFRQSHNRIFGPDLPGAS